MVLKVSPTVRRLVVTSLLLWAIAAVTYGTLRLTFGPRPVYIHVRWAPTVDDTTRQRLEQRHSLSEREFEEGSTWGYTLLDLSRDNIRALVSDTAVEDTHYIHRTAFRPWRFAPRRPYPTAHAWIPIGLELFGAAFLFAGTVGIGLVFLERAAPRAVRGPVIALRGAFLAPLARPTWLWVTAGGVLIALCALVDLLQIQSLWLLLAGAAVLWGAGATTERRRRNVTVATLLLVGVMTVAFPIDPSFGWMGDSSQHAESRSNFERHFGGSVRFERHLSHVILRQLYLQFDQTEEAPRRALVTLARSATAWFVISAFAIGFLERWSPVILRYIGLALLAPATLLYFGWQEFGYLALNVAAFPLLLHGLRDGGTRLEAGSALTGLGAALHGFGLVSLVGAWIAALGSPERLRDRVGRALRIAAWGTAAYLGWVAVYVIVLNVPIDPGPAAAIPWRPWLVGEVRDHRLSAALLSATTGRDLFMTGWVVGAPLLIVAASLWRRYTNEVRIVLCYSLPSIFFEVFRWPVQGLGRGMDLVVATFPALYALAWVCAQDPKRTRIAAALLISAHPVFWRIVLDPQFVNTLLE